MKRRFIGAKRAGAVSANLGQQTLQTPKQRVHALQVPSPLDGGGHHIGGEPGIAPGGDGNDVEYPDGSDIRRLARHLIRRNQCPGVEGKFPARGLYLLLGVSEHLDRNALAEFGEMGGRDRRLKLGVDRARGQPMAAVEGRDEGEFHAVRAPAEAPDHIQRMAGHARIPMANGDPAAPKLGHGVKLGARLDHEKKRAGVKRRGDGDFDRFGERWRTG